MSDSRQNLIQDLVADLKPVERPGRTGLTLIVWLALAIAYSMIIVFATGPLREGAFQNLVREPAFAIETLLAIAAIVLLAHATLRTAIPGAAGRAKQLAAALIVTAAWFLVYVVGLVYPAHPVSTLGARDYCIWQVVLFSVPSFALMLWFARRLLPLWPRTTSLLAGAAAAAIPGSLMQFGCMYVPEHILTHHIGPIFIVAAIGAVIGRIVLTTRRTVPRSRGVSLH
jgi:hypothetical protein